jgi:hypothetical protein
MKFKMILPYLVNNDINKGGKTVLFCFETLGNLFLFFQKNSKTFFVKNKVCKNMEIV